MMRLSLVLLIALLAGIAQAVPRDYQIDPVHTRIAFSIDHLGYSQSLGTFSGPTGTLRFDPEDWSSAEVDVHIPLARLDLGDTAWNARMLRRDYFDADRHPLAHFRATRIEPQDSHSARVIGVLSLRGVEREVTLDVRLNKLGRNPLTLRRTAGFSATTTLKRSDFGMTAHANSVGDLVSLTLQIEATRSRRGDQPLSPSEPPPAEESDHAMAQQPE